MRFVNPFFEIFPKNFRKKNPFRTTDVQRNGFNAAPLQSKMQNSVRCSLKDLFVKFGQHSLF